MPAEGGEARQVTKGGGFAPVASADAEYIFYAKNRDLPGVWRVPVGGGEEIELIASPKAWLWGYWGVTEQGVYFVETDDRNPSAGATLNYYDFAQRGIRKIAALEKPPVRGDSGLAVSADGKEFLYAQADYSNNDIILVENYR